MIIVHSRARLGTGVLGAALLLLAGCTEPGETTGMGAATGSAIGAGVGAIIGSQTGGAGAGLVLGAVAGGGTGALIANSLEAQEKGIRNQEEALERQEQTIQAQRREIEELRRGGGSDTYSSFSGSSSTQSARPQELSSDQQRMKDAYARAKPLRENDLIGSRRDIYEGSAAYQGGSVNRGTFTRESAQPDRPRRVVDDQQIATTRGSAFDSGAPNIGSIADESGYGNDAAKSDSSVPDSNAAFRVSSTECREAEQEVKKGQDALESADKLFHLRRALRLCPTNPTYHNQLGELYLSLNRKSDAEYEFKEALALNPTYAMAEQNLERVRR